MSIGIDEQIGFMNCGAANIPLERCEEISAAILATLRRWKVIEDAGGEVPEYPEIVRCPACEEFGENECSHYNNQSVARHAYDTLRNLLAAERANGKELKRIKELLREPSEEMMDAYWARRLSTGIEYFKAMSAALLAQVEKEMNDE